MNFNEKRKLIQAAQKAQAEIRKMVVVMGNDSLNHYEQSFRNQGFTDDGLERWQKRKKRDNGRAILTKTGALRRSLKKLSRGRYAIQITSNLPYALIHNNGGTIRKSERGGHVLSFNKKGRFTRQRTERQRSSTSHQQKVTIGSHGIKIPKRQFVGYSGKLNRRLIKKFDKTIRDIFR